MMDVMNHWTIHQIIHVKLHTIKSICHDIAITIKMH